MVEESWAELGNIGDELLRRGYTVLVPLHIIFCDGDFDWSQENLERQPTGIFRRNYESTVT